MIITRVSMFTGQVNSMDLPVTEEQLRRWAARENVIQNIFPHLSADEREFIMTGTTKEEWDKEFK